MRVKDKKKEYDLQDGERWQWNAEVFERTKKIARRMAKVVCVDEKGEKYLIPISDLEVV